jgi:hypothetical protein
MARGAEFAVQEVDAHNEHKDKCPQSAAETESSGRPSTYRNLYFSGQVRNVKRADHEM